MSAAGRRAWVAAVPLAAALLGASAASAQEREEPLWEAGAGASALYLPDYRGASSSRWYALPVPYFVYHGDFFKSDRHGVRGVLFKSDRIDFHLSAGASLPVDSSESEERQGMPDLGPAVELGPSVEINLWRSADRGAKLDLRFPVRFAVTLESDPRYIGAQFLPHLNVDVTDVGGFRGWNLGMLAGPVYADSRYNEHFYSVAPRYATGQRPAYDAPGGYGGAQFLVALSKRFPRFWVGAFLRYDTLAGAGFADSALVTADRYVAGGVAVSWIFKESSRRVTVRD